jgi:putative PIN family toxin of toxin-antitoxin system
VSRYFVIDTNMLVAGLLTAHADSPVARILDGMLTAAFPFVVSESLLAEYHAVLVRPKLCKLHGLSVAEIDTILTDIARHAIVLNPTTTANNPVAPDLGDQFLWDLLAARADLVLVTGDKLLFQDAAMPDRVILPQAFVAQWGH